jgi:RimJ/RimL family protein N-acetyltransferase
VWILTQSLETGRLVLRRFLPPDAPELFELRADPSVSAYDAWEPYVSEDQARAFIASQRGIEPDTEGHWCAWAIVLKADAKVIGNVEMVVRSQSWRQAEIGWALKVAYRGAGYATEAARRMIGFGFEDLGMHRIYAECDPENRASLRMMERLGMRWEAHLREVTYVRGAWHDRIVYAVLAREWDRRFERKSS